MRSKWILPTLALGLLVYAFVQALYMQRREPMLPPPVSPSLTPFGNTVAGAGMIEPNTEASGKGMIEVGSQVAGVVTAVRVRIGQTVKAGDLLFELDKRQAEAELRVRQAAVSYSQAQLRQLELQPRIETVRPMEAQVAVAEATERQTSDVVSRDARVTTGVITEEDRVAHQEAWQLARAQLQFAKANLGLLKAGAWDPDKAIARANVEQAQAQVDQAKTNLELLSVRAPANGTILQVNVRTGEYVTTFGGQSLIAMGNLDPLNVRVNVDEEDLPRLKLNAPARAKIRGDAKQEEIPLTFVRLEPVIVPKTSLTGANTERVDTRVVQLIYAIDSKNKLAQENKVLVGQLVDVFIDTRSPP
jgi:HlyD family secretion protein